MRGIKLILIMFVLLSGILSLSSCSKERLDMTYEDIKTQPSDIELSFNTDLSDDNSLYPISKGKKYYISNNGDDKNDGLSINKPIKTIRKANSLDLKAGDSLLFKCNETFVGNLYFNNINGDDDNPITIASYGNGDRPIITNGDSIENVIWIEKGSNIVVRDLMVKAVNSNREDTSRCIGGISFTYQYVGTQKFRNIYIYNNVVTGSGIGSNIMGIEITSLESTHQLSPTNVLTNCFVRNNEVSNIGRSGIHCGGWLMNERINKNEGHLDKFVNFHFDSNTVYDVGAMGVYIVACKNSTILRNTIYRAGVYYKNEIMEGQAGIMALSTLNCDIMFNEVFECSDGKTGYDAMGIDIDWNTYNVNVQYNYCHDNMGSGIGTMANQSSFIRNNKVVNNLCDTNNYASIYVCNFTSRYDAVREDWHSVKNLLIEENLVIHKSLDKYAFGVKNSNGDQDFIGNQFISNRVICRDENVSKLIWINVDNGLAWNKFENNKYYSFNNTKFTCFDFTPSSSISTDNGAEQYCPSKDRAFCEWQKRDKNSTYELIDDNLIPSNPYNPDLKFENGKLTFSWSGDKKEGFWHYNIFKIRENEDICYQNMLFETKDNSFEYTPDCKEICYFIIQPESNQGTLGKALKIKVSLN